MKAKETLVMREIKRKAKMLPAYPRPKGSYWKWVSLGLLVFGLSYGTLLTSESSFFTLVSLCLSYMLLAVFAISLGHQAFHGSLFESSKLNQWIGGLLFAGLGLDGTLWQLRHLRDHHPRPNTKGHDLDLDNPLFFRLAPYIELRWYHRFQHLYAPFLYSIATLITISVDDFRSLKVECRKLPIAEAVRLAGGFASRKLAFLMCWFALPLALNPSLDAGRLISMFALSSIPVGWIFLPIAAAHLNEYTEFFEQGAETSFFRTQRETTIDFCADSGFMTALYGGLNCHLAHHLWPKVAGCHYSDMYSLLDDAGEALPLNLSIYELMKSHFRFLKAMGSECSPGNPADLPLRPTWSPQKKESLDQKRA